KNFLKPFVCAFVLLGTISSLAPSHAMEGTDDREGLSLVTLKKGKQKPEEKLEEANDFIPFFPEELTQHILLQDAPEDISNVTLTCKKWLRLTLNDPKFLKAFYEKNRQNPERLKQLIS